VFVFVTRNVIVVSKAKANLCRESEALFQVSLDGGVPKKAGVIRISNFTKTETERTMFMQLQKVLNYFEDAGDIFSWTMLLREVNWGENIKSV
jgi:hypothetical protein